MDPESALCTCDVYRVLIVWYVCHDCGVILVIMFTSVICGMWLVGSVSVSWNQCYVSHPSSVVCVVDPWGKSHHCDLGMWIP